MAILELGINLGNRNIFERQYYSASDNVLDPNLRAGFLSALESFSSEVFGDDINVVSLASFKLVCYSDLIALPGSEEKDNTQPLLYYAIIEKETETDVVKKHLKEINAHFLNRFPRNDIFSKKKKYFEKRFTTRIDDVLGDLRLKTEDRFRSIF
ncbi:MAG: hypothetical protein GF317_07440 [Candidatus Lokiarchaeota archaeon]|nr:hypothetical protein [Candidatus Lokiarchaeota archaeon]MBD3199542.1 hypothetical protein [Candidatus Lokiarchaeota archaeon]